MLLRISAFVLALCASVAAHASVLSSALTFNGRPDQISTTTPAGLATAEGDFVYGFVVGTSVRTDFTHSAPFNPGAPVQSGTGTNTTLAANNYIIAMFGGVVTTDALGRSTLSASNVAGKRLYDKLSSDFQTAITGFENQTSVVVISGSSTDPFAVDNSLGNGLASFFTSANYKFDLAATTNGGFFQSVPGPGLGIGDFVQRGGFNVLTSTLAANTNFLNVPVQSLFGAPPVTAAQLALDNTFVNITAPTNGWTFQNQSSSMRLNAVPEPTSLVAFGGLLVLGFVVRRRAAR